MQNEGKVKFLRHHQGSVRGVAFSPRQVDVEGNLRICAGPLPVLLRGLRWQGQLVHGPAAGAAHVLPGNLPHPLVPTCLLTVLRQITTMGLARNVNAVRFTSDGSRVCHSSVEIYKYFNHHHVTQ
ncbi:hypothetical protein LAZ67_19002229 [Cordylochernes scorpioides]|uniref:Uncharacterized protein n=1 Tax=Cordylochernes scorpioides TaxID=51811 RepID=A0ABY6LN62_9ARAC|nr:hypothetical protein LAZ67_19002229 [Cordylochernes scorpioides]